MSTGPVQTPAARQAEAAQQATLDTLVGIAAQHANEQLTPTIAKLAAALADVAQPGLDAQAGYLRVKSGKLLKDNAYAFFHLASTAIELALRQAVDSLRPGATGRVAPASLSLVPLEEVDNALAFAALSRPFDLVHAEALATLSVRLGLLLGRGVLRADANPFRPAVFLQALDAAWRDFEPDAEAHGVLASVLQPAHLFDFAPMYEALAAALKRKEGQAGSNELYHIQKTDDGAAARAARATAKAALAEQLRKLFGDDGGDDGVPLIPDLPGLPSGNGGWRPSGAAGFAGAAAGEGGGAPAATGEMAPQAPAGVVAAATGAAMFAGAQGAAAVAAGMAAPGFITVPAGHVVMAPGFAQAAGASPLVAPGAHAGPLLDLLARMEPVLQAAAAPAPAAPDGSATPHNVFYLPRFRQSLPKGSLPRRDEHTLDLLSRVFETVLLDDSISAQTRELLQLLQVPVLKAALADRNFFFEEAHPARRLVDLLSRMGWEQQGDSGGALLETMRRSVAKVDRDADKDAFAAAVAELEAGIAAEEAAHDDVEKSVLAAPVANALKQEKMLVATRAARDAIALRLGAGNVEEVISGFLEQRWTTVLTFAYSIEDDKPGAVGSATRAMDDLIWSVQPKPTQDQKKALITRLPRLLATLNKWLDAIRWQDAERLQFFARLAEYHASIVRAPVEMSPERQLELAVEAAQQDALRKVSMEKAAAEQAEARRRDASPLDGLERGTWCEFRQGDARRKVKLAWVSPMRTLFIFSGAGRQEAFSMPADKLTAALHAGTARVLAIDGVVGQVLSEAMGSGAVNDAVAAMPAAHAV